MAIQLDATSSPSTASVEELRDQAKAAIEAVRYWDGVLRQRVSEAEALDGWFASAVASLMGTREERIEACVARVQDARVRLAAARRAADDARAAAEAGEQQQRAALDDQVQRVGQLELLAEEIRGSGHPLAAELDEIELGIEEARQASEPLTEAVESGHALLGVLGTIGVQAQQGASAARLDLGNVPFAGLRKLDRMRHLRKQVPTLVPKARRFEDACATVGLHIELGIDQVEAPSYLIELITDDVFTEMATLQRIEELGHRLEMAGQEIRHALEPLQERRKDLGDQLKGLEARRAALLERAAG